MSEQVLNLLDGKNESFSLVDFYKKNKHVFNVDKKGNIKLNKKTINIEKLRLDFGEREIPYGRLQKVKRRPTKTPSKYLERQNSDLEGVDFDTGITYTINENINIQFIRESDNENENLNFKPGNKITVFQLSSKNNNNNNYYYYNPDDTDVTYMINKKNFTKLIKKKIITEN